MMLTVFVMMQIVFDVVVLALAAVYLLGRKAEPPPTAPPEWYEQFLALARELMATTEPVIDRLEAQAPPADATAARQLDDDEARALLRAGVRADDAAGRTGLLPGEIRLLANVVAAEARAGIAPGALVGGRA
jgi:hypothetical protein